MYIHFLISKKDFQIFSWLNNNIRAVSLTQPVSSLSFIFLNYESKILDSRCSVSIDKNNVYVISKVIFIHNNYSNILTIFNLKTYYIKYIETRIGYLKIVIILKLFRYTGLVNLSLLLTTTSWRFVYFTVLCVCSFFRFWALTQ